MTYLEELGRELASERVAAGWEQEAVAERVGISRVTLSRYENGHQKASHEVIRRIRGLYAQFPRGPDGGEGQPSDDTSGIAVPRLARNLPLAVREYLLTVRARFTRADVPEEMIDEAMDLLRSPSVFSYFKGGKLSEYNEQDVLDGMRTLVDDVVVPRLRKLGFKVP